MPFNEFRLRDSWPPTIVHIHHDANTEDSGCRPTSEIDDDPFSYFLTSPDDILDADCEDLSAGIEGPSLHSNNNSSDTKSSHPRNDVREISPSSIQRSSRARLRPLIHYASEREREIDNEEAVYFFEGDDSYDDDDDDYTYSTSYPDYDDDDDDDYDNEELPRPSRPRQRTEDMLAGPGITLPEDAKPNSIRRDSRPLKGILKPSSSSPSLSSSSRRFSSVAERGSSRERGLYMAARRPHSWRLPSPEIMSIVELEEEVEEKSKQADKVESTEKIEEELSAPLRCIDMRESASKPKKRVHWAF